MTTPLGSFPARVDELATILDALATRAIELAVPDAVRDKLSLMVEELFLNTVHYGGAGVLLATLALERLPDTVHLIYEDNGRAYDPFAHANRETLTEDSAGRRIGGLGVILIEGLASATHYERLADRNRIQLTLTLASPAM